MTDQDTVLSGAAEDSLPTADEIEVVTTPDTPSADSVSGEDGVAGGDNEPPEPGDPPGQPGKSRAARQRERLRLERDHAIGVAQHLDQQARQLAAERHAMQQYIARVDRENVENRYAYLKTLETNFVQAKQQALSSGDVATATRIDAEAAKLGAALLRAEEARARYAQQQPPQQIQQPVVQQPVQQRPAQQPQRLHPMAEKWADTNDEWLNSDRRNREIAATVGRALEAQGFAVDSPDYYARLNQGIRVFSPEFRSDFNPASTRPTQSASPGTVAGVERTSTVPVRGTTKVQLTADELAFCERTGVNPKSYGRMKLERDMRDAQARR